VSISSQLRDAIKDSGQSANALARATGVPQPTITRFLNGAQMRTENIDRLAEYFGLKLCREKKTKG
jgi:plasmid maintenance system antidote protein VapI